MTGHTFFDLVMVLIIVGQAFWLHAKDLRIDQCEKTMDEILRDLLHLKSQAEEQDKVRKSP